MNKRLLSSLAAVVLAIGGFGALTGLAGSPNGPVDPPAAATTRNSDGRAPGILKEVKFDAVPLGHILDFMHEFDPRFIFTLVRDPGVPEDFPSISIRAQDLDYEQFLQLIIMSHPSVSLDTVPGPRVVAYSIHISGNNPAELPPQPPLVEVYSIPALRDSKGAASLTPALSLIEAAVAQVPSEQKPVLQAHEPTRTLIVKGTAAQQQTVAAALKALAGEYVARHQLPWDDSRGIEPAAPKAQPTAPVTQPAESR